MGAAVAGVAAQRFRTTVRAKSSWQQSMLRIKDPEKSLEFYRDKMGMRHETVFSNDFYSLKKNTLFMLQCSQMWPLGRSDTFCMDSSLLMLIFFFFVSRLLDKLDFESMSFSLYFLASVPEEETTPEPGTAEAHQYLWTFPRTTLDRSSVFMKMPISFFTADWVVPLLVVGVLKS